MLKIKIKALAKKVIRLYYLTIINVSLHFGGKKETLPEKDDTLDKIYKKIQTTCFTEDRIFNNTYHISIIIPIYNGEKYLRRCIESVLNNNTCYKYELILVNDGSTDKTEDIIQEYRQKYPKIIKTISKTNGGLSDARNAGLDIADGKYISFIDCDDYISNDYIKTLLDIAYAKNADAVKCSTAHVSSKGKITAKDVYRNMDIVGEMGDKIMDIKSYVWGGIYKNTLLKNLKFPEGYWYEDMIWRFLVYRRASHFISLNKTLHYRQMHEEQLTGVQNKSNNKCLDHLYLVESLIEDNKSFNLKQDEAFYRNILHESSAILLSRIGKMDEETKRQVFLRTYNIINETYKPEYEKKIKGNMKTINKVIRNRRYDLWLKLKYI